MPDIHPDRGLVGSILQRANDSVMPFATWLLSELRDTPRLCFQLVLEFLREDFVGSPSRLAYSLSSGTEEVDLPDPFAPA